MQTKTVTGAGALGRGRAKHGLLIGMASPYLGSPQAWCRIAGLTSEPGLTLNGTAARMMKPELLATAGLDDRLPVEIEGQQDGMLIKRRNLAFPTVQTCTTGAGYCKVLSNNLGESAITYLRWKSGGAMQKTLQAELAREPERLKFESLDQLPAPMQFLLSCGPLADLRRAQSALLLFATPALLALQNAWAPDVGGRLLQNVQAQATTADAAVADEAAGADTALVNAPSGIVDAPACTVLAAEVMGPAAGVGALRAPGAGLTALEWAAKHGNSEIVEWLCTDERTSILVRTGAPVGWACYAGHVELVRRTTRPDPCAAPRPPGAHPLVAGARARAPRRRSEGGRLRAVARTAAASARGVRRPARGGAVVRRGAAREHPRDRRLRGAPRSHARPAQARARAAPGSPQVGILHHVHSASDKWEEMAGHVAVDEYAREKGARKQHIRKAP